jgi:hypothetical protein
VQREPVDTGVHESLIVRFDKEFELFLKSERILIREVT